MIYLFLLKNVFFGLQGKCGFAFLAIKIDFVVLKENVILWFWRKYSFQVLAKNVILWFWRENIIL